MFKKILSYLLALSIILSMSTAVFAVDTEITCSKISFTDLSGNPVTEISTQPIIAKTTVVTNSTDKKPVLLVCRYEGGMLKEIWHKTADNLTGEISLQFTPTVAAGVIKATLLDGLKTLNYPSASAKLSEDNTDLALVKVNGEVFTEYDNSKDNYAIKVNSNSTNTVEALPADGGTTIEIEDVSTLPGDAKIKITSASGIKRTVNISFYTDDSQLEKLIGLTYFLDGVRTEISGFNPDTTDYTINLPDNTFFVTLDPQAIAITDTSVKIYDSNFKNKVFTTEYEGVVYDQEYALKNKNENSDSYNMFSFGYDNLISKGRPAVNNVIPIRNEETTVKITTSCVGGSNPKTYSIKFTAKQPRIIEFDVSQAVKDADDRYYPVFVGGAAAYNDNGTPTGQDGSWALGNISKNLIGTSVFAMYLRLNVTNRDSSNRNKWFDNNTSGEYFHFKANTGGTLYLLSANPISNSDYNIPASTDEIVISENWTKISSYEPDVPEGYTSWNLVPRNYNDFPDGKFYVQKIEFNDDTAGKRRYEAGAMTMDIGSLSPQGFSHAYARTFEAGEEVKIYHSGLPGNGAAYIAFIKWDGVNIPNEVLGVQEESVVNNEISLLSESAPEPNAENPDVVKVGGTVEPYSKVSFMLLDSTSMGCETEVATFDEYKALVDQNTPLTTSQIFFYENVMADADGKWDYTIPMTDILFKDLTLVTNTGKVEYIQYASTAYKTGMLPTIKNAANVADDGTALKDVLYSDDYNYIVYVSDRAKQYKNLNDDNKLKVAQFSKGIIAALDLESETALSDLKEAIDSAIVIFGVKEGDITDFEEAMSIVSYDTTENSNITSIGKQKLITLLKNDEYASIDDYKDKAKVHFTLQLFNYNTKNTGDNLLEVLEDNNSILELDLTELHKLNDENQSKAAKELSLKLSESVDDAQDNLDEIVRILAEEEGESDEIPPPGGGGGGGGIGSATTKDEHKAHNSSASQSISNEYLQEQKYTYPDMKEASWAADAVSYLSKEGIISGYKDNSFKPLNPITRAEFTKLIVSAFCKNKEFEFSGNFKDINSSEWYAEYVNIAYNMGIVSGDEKGNFNPNATISREDMAVIIYNAGIKFNLFEQTSEYYQFNDDSSISDYAKTAVYTLKSKSVVNGTGNGLFSPKESADRASAAKILYELIISNVE